MSVIIGLSHLTNECWSPAGVIDECTPGGWYVLKDVHHRAELGFPLVVGPDHIELIPTSCKAMITEMSHLVKDYNFQNMVTTYQDYLTQYFRYFG